MFSACRRKKVIWVWGLMAQVMPNHVFQKLSCFVILKIINDTAYNWWFWQAKEQQVGRGQGKPGEMLEKAAEVMMGCFRVCTSDRSVHWACQLSQLFCSRNCMAYLRYMYCNTVSHLLWHQNAWEISLHKVWRWTNVLNHETIKLWFERRVGSLSFLIEFCR